MADTEGFQIPKEIRSGSSVSRRSGIGTAKGTPCRGHTSWKAFAYLEATKAVG